MPAKFDMPGAAAGFEARGGWVASSLARDFSLTLPLSCGIVGNVGYESEGFTALQEVDPLVDGSRGGAGWGMWTGPRRRSFEAWCGDQALDLRSDEANFGYLEAELRGAYAYVLNALRRETTLERAVFVFGRLYEAPFGTTATHLPGYNDRLLYARRALAGARRLPARETGPAATPTAQGGGRLGALHLGATGPAVIELKRRLNAAGIDPPLELTDSFDSDTDDAVRAFQRDQGLAVDGWAGPATWQHLPAGESR